jgi:hypothetical protein
MYQKNVSISVLDNAVEENYFAGAYVGENSESLLCRLEDGLVFNTGLTMVMFYGDPLLRLVIEIIDLVVNQVYATTGLTSQWPRANYILRMLLSIIRLIDIIVSTFSHITSLLSPLNGLVSMCPLFYFRFFLEPLVKQNSAKFITCVLLSSV